MRVLNDEGLRLLLQIAHIKTALGWLLIDYFLKQHILEYVSKNLSKPMFFCPPFV